MGCQRSRLPASRKRESHAVLRYPEGSMLRRWGIALVLSIAAHLTVVGGIVATLIVSGLTFSAPVDVEITGMRLDEVHDLPLGPPPSAATHPGARPRPPP